MPYEYSILPSNTDSHQASPYWLGAVVRQKYLTSLSLEAMVHEETNSSLPVVFNNPVAEIPMLLIDVDCTQWTVTHSKNSHLGNCNLNLVGAKDYTKEVAPDDWLLFWAFDNYEDYNRIRKAVKSGKVANDFKSGLKFVGRVDSVRKNLQRAGIKLNASYQITATSFRELESAIYYNPILMSKYQTSMVQWMIDFAGEANNFLNAVSTNNGLLHSQDIIPRLIRILLGLGPGEASKGIRPENIKDNAIQQSLQKTASALAPNTTYRIPQSVSTLLGVASPVNSLFPTYADLLQKWIGIQEYTDSSTASNRDSNQGHFAGFLPYTSSDDGNSTFLCRTALSGDFLIAPLTFDNKSVWQIIKTYLNEPVDEMYTTLRVGRGGAIMPTLIARQIPFSSDRFAQFNIPCTPFSNLPRWEISTDLITSIDTGTNNALRFNYVHLQGQSITGISKDGNNILGLARHPPVVDIADISRSGLRAMMRNVHSNVNEVFYANNTSPGGAWQKLMADILMGGQLRHAGSITSKLIQDPIPVGDNCVVDGILYHIEQITHTGSLNPFDGIRDSNTVIGVSHGITKDGKFISESNHSFEVESSANYINESLDAPSTIGQRATTQKLLEIDRQEKQGDRLVDTITDKSF